MYMRSVSWVLFVNTAARYGVGNPWTCYPRSAVRRIRESRDVGLGSVSARWNSLATDTGYTWFYCSGTVTACVLGGAVTRWPLGWGALQPGLHSPALSEDVRPGLPVSHGMWLVSGVIAPVSMGTRPSHAREKQRATCIEYRRWVYLDVWGNLSDFWGVAKGVKNWFDLTGVVQVWPSTLPVLL